MDEVRRCQAPACDRALGTNPKQRSCSPRCAKRSIRVAARANAIAAREVRWCPAPKCGRALGTNPKQKFCNDACAARFRRAAARSEPAVRWCQCGKALGTNPNQLHCTPACAQRFQYANRAKACAAPACSTAADPGRDVCGMHYARLKKYGTLELPLVLCETCGRQVDRKVGPGVTRKFCDDCYRQRARTNAHYQHATRHYPLTSGDRTISIPKLGDRDGWRCHICGKGVRRSGGRDPKAPSIDHLVPLSLGGEHEWVNIALAHKGCNSARGNRGLAQLKLIS